MLCNYNEARCYGMSLLFLSNKLCANMKKENANNKIYDWQ